MTAKAVCSVAWLATQAGATGVSHLAKDPERRGENYATHLAMCLGVSDMDDTLVIVGFILGLCYLEATGWGQGNCASRNTGGRGAPKFASQYRHQTCREVWVCC
jgi:F0F1-type ATP synthase membrane subunit c/vacuolar-type H+-ATPase subunit K